MAQDTDRVGVVAVRTQWKWALGVNIFLSNTPPSGSTIYIHSIKALQEEDATTGTGATLTVGRSSVSVPTLRGGVSQADYVECSSVTQASSCRAFDANNTLLPNTLLLLNDTIVTQATSPPSAGGPIEVLYKPGVDSRSRVEVSVFEWGADSDKLGPF